jgi:coenzyme F420-dependent glucose-6-phosphate dehydrogenase
MTAIGFHASHEQHRPSDLLGYVELAASAGLAHGMCSDHLHPWSEQQAQSGYAWSWLGAALESTSLDYGTVCAPGYRYHPAIIAQAAATLAEMYPGRLWLAIGSGEALNEAVTGTPWPAKDERNARLKECADIIRALWNGETVDHAGYVTVRNAKLYTRPQEAPRLFGAALSEQTARWLGGWADGMITAGASHDGLRKVVDAFRDGGGEGKPVFLQAAVCLANTDHEALQQAHQRWRMAALQPEVLSSLRTPTEFDQATRDISPEEMRSKLRIASDPNALWDSLMRDAELGFDRIYVHHVGEDTPEFIERFARLLSPTN